MVNTFTLKRNDLQPYYYVKAINAYDSSNIDLAGATIYATMKSATAGTLKIDRQTTGINLVTDGSDGEFYYAWQSGDTDTAGLFEVEFEVVPASGGKFTIPGADTWLVEIEADLDAT